jgi:hypothetical protein
MISWVFSAPENRPSKARHLKCTRSNVWVFQKALIAFLNPEMPLFLTGAAL